MYQPAGKSMNKKFAGPTVQPGIPPQSGPPALKLRAILQLVGFGPAEVAGAQPTVLVVKSTEDTTDPGGQLDAGEGGPPSCAWQILSAPPPPKMYRELSGVKSYVLFVRGSGTKLVPFFRATRTASVWFTRSHSVSTSHGPALPVYLKGPATKSKFCVRSFPFLSLSMSHL